MLNLPYHVYIYSNKSRKFKSIHLLLVETRPFKLSSVGYWPKVLVKTAFKYGNRTFWKIFLTSIFNHVSFI